MNDNGAAPGAPRATETKILDVAQEMIQTVGFAAFSYRDIAARLGLRTATLHYYFPAKADLACAVARRYAAQFTAALAEIDTAPADAPTHLRRYAGLYRSGLVAHHRRCLAAAVLDEADILPVGAVDEARRFVDANLAWLEAVIAAGIAAATLAPGVPASQAAHLALATVQGAAALARLDADARGFDLAVDALLLGWTAAGGRKKGPTNPASAR